MEMSANDAERMIAEARDKERRDRIAEIQYAQEKGEAKAHLAVARNIKTEGLDVLLITRMTGFVRGGDH